MSANEVRSARGLERAPAAARGARFSGRELSPPFRLRPLAAGLFFAGYGRRAVRSGSRFYVDQDLGVWVEI